MSPKQGPKILFIDIEVSPNVVTSWGLWVNGGLNHENIEQERSIISASWKWKGEKEVRSSQISSARPTDDRKVVIDICNAIEEADAVVAHNGNKFDFKWIRTRRVFHKMPPLPRFLQVDTRRIAKDKFYFNSNKLDYLAQFLGIGGKIQTDYKLWKRCLKGEKKAIDEMVRYNKMDVVLLEKVYDRLVPYMPANYGTMFLTDKSRPSCPQCGGEKVQRRGYDHTRTNKYERWKCMTTDTCGHWFRLPIKKGK